MEEHMLAIWFACGGAVIGAILVFLFAKVFDILGQQKERIGGLAEGLGYQDRHFSTRIDAIGIVVDGLNERMPRAFMEQDKLRKEAVKMLNEEIKHQTVVRIGSREYYQTHPMSVVLAYLLDELGFRVEEKKGLEFINTKATKTKIDKD